MRIDTTRGLLPLCTLAVYILPICSVMSAQTPCVVLCGAFAPSGGVLYGCRVVVSATATAIVHHRGAVSMD